jgi:chitodextrinase
LQASNQGSADPNFILSMLQQMRSLHSNYLNPLAPGVTDVRLFSVRTAYGIVGLHIKPGTGNPASSDTSPPTAPGSLTAAAASSSQINLGWTASKDNVGVTGYLVERCQGAGCTSFVQMATSTGTTYNDTGRAGNTSYSYRVRATDAAGNLSPYSNIASATTPQGTTTSSQGTTSGLVAAYGFNEATGTTVADASGNGNTGTITNAAWTTGKYGAGLSFNGTNALVTINDSASLRLTAAMTLEAWVKMASVVNQWEDIVYKGNDNYFLEATSSKNVPAGGGTFGTAGAAVYGTSALPPNTWTHLAVTYDGATLRLYVNGVQVSSLARTGNIVTSTNPLQIGGDSLFRQYFNGIIDEVRVYNVALTAAQIQTDMNAAIGGSGDTQPPTVPSNLTATVASSSQINLSWTASTDNVGVTGYLVERCQGAGCTSFAQIATSTGTIYNDTGRAPNTAYSYRVRAMDAAGNLSPYSNVASATTQASTPGLVAAYGFNEGTGTTVADASGNGNTGTISNATWTTGKYGKGLSFNGSNTLVTINDSASLHLTAAMTLEAWVNMGIVDNQWEDIVYKGNDNYYLEATSSKNVPAGGGTFGTAGAAAYGTSALPQNAWTHVAVTYDGATLRLYVNGVQVSSLARTGNLVTSTNPLQIGGDSFYRQYFHGIIDEVRVYNVALTAAQIQTDIGNPLP